MSSGRNYQTCAWLRHLVNAYGVTSLVRLIAAVYRRVWQLLAWLNPVVIPGCYTWPACRYLCCPAWQFVVCKCVCHLWN